MIDHPTVPDGWMAEGWTSGPYGKHYTILRHPNPRAGVVTIDWDKRGFRAGASAIGKMTSTATYTGRGWKERLVADAVAWLDTAWNKHGARR